MQKQTMYNILLFKNLGKLTMNLVHFQTFSMRIFQYLFSEADNRKYSVYLCSFYLIIENTQ